VKKFLGLLLLISTAFACKWEASAPFNTLGDFQFDDPPPLYTLKTHPLICVSDNGYRRFQVELLLFQQCRME
jgi:hypothetical protein